jgi:hypothetical protein
LKELENVEKPQGLKGEPCATPATTNAEPRTTNAFLRMKLVGANRKAKVTGLGAEVASTRATA